MIDETRNYHPHKFFSALFPYVAAFVLSILLTGCNFDSPKPEESAVPVNESTETITTTVPLDGSISPSNQARALVVWVPEFLDANPENTAGGVLQAAFTQFEQAQPGMRVEVQTKAEFGTSSLFNYVRSARAVAPLVLPDVILIDTQQLWRIVDMDLIVPLSDAELGEMGDIYPFAIDSVRYNDHFYGIPYVADVSHLAVLTPLGEGSGTTEQATAEVPSDWIALLNSGQTYIFPASGIEGLSSSSLLLQYVGAGGQLSEGGATNNKEALVRVFNFLSAGSKSNTIVADSVDYSSLGAVWSRFLDSEINFADVSAAQYMANRESSQQTSYAQIPTLSGSPTTIGQTWAFAILTQDPERKALALELIQLLLEPSIQGLWSQFAHRLPTRQSALDTWEISPPYIDFLSVHLDVAVAIPNGPAFADFSARLQAAQLAVINGEITPQDAASQVLAPQ